MNPDVNKIYEGDCLSLMKGWPSGMVDCCVTSPPYWGLRDYGVDGQSGLEETPEEYVAKMVEIFAEVHRVLKPEGNLWLNLGDSYAGSGKGYNVTSSKQQTNAGSQSMSKYGGKVPNELKPKDLIGIPWRVAFALQEYGWYLRQDIIWHKPNPMPESVTDRCTKAHEYIFLLSKSAKYYYDNEAIKEDAVETNDARPRMGQGINTIYNSKRGYVGMGQKTGLTNGKKNKRSVWTVPIASYNEAHFATFSPKLIEPCILAGCPEWICPKCGKARERIIEKKASTMNIRVRDAKKGILKNKSGFNESATDKEILAYGKEILGETQTVGFTDCGCGAGFEPGLVLDPFMGSGTTAMVAYENNRNYIGCEINPEYIKLNRADKAADKYSLLESNL